MKACAEASEIAA